MIRTDFTRKQWLEMMASIGGFESECLPYNAYHQAYQSEMLENHITLPLIRAHHRLKRRFGKYPLLRTRPSVARADLLYSFRRS